MKTFVISDFAGNLPTVDSAHIVLYNPQAFHTPCRFRTKKNTAFLFLSNGGFRYRLKSVEGTDWKIPSVGDTKLLYQEAEFWAAPRQASVSTEPSLTVSDGAAIGTEMFLLVEYPNTDFHMAEVRRQKRIRAIPDEVMAILLRHRPSSGGDKDRQLQVDEWVDIRQSKTVGSVLENEN